MIQRTRQTSYIAIFAAGYLKADHAYNFIKVHINKAEILKKRMCLAEEKLGSSMNTKAFFQKQTLTFD